ncbi:MAG: MFS transporter [Candidatus Cloacimonadales bacterium]
MKDFLKNNLNLIAFGIILTFFSSFGQTFLLSLYVPSIEKFLQISNTQFGSIYAIATLSSGLTLPWAGGYFDKIPTRYYSLIVILGLSLMLLLLSFSYHVIMVVIAFYGLRLFGQGLMGHTSISTMAKYFERHRGKAISLASLGYPAGEAILPIIISFLILSFGWRGALRLSAVSSFLVLAPLSFWLLNRSERVMHKSGNAAKIGKPQIKKINIARELRNRNFWVITPIAFMLGFANTALFFFQLKLGAAKGWSPAWVASSISFYALANALGMLGVGSLVDRWSGRKLFPYFLVPYLLGLLVLILFRHPLIYPLALALMGVGSGAGSTIRSAMVAEIYGVKVIGQIRSIFTTVMVLSTSVGPLAFGILLDLELSFSVIFSLVFLAMLAAGINGLRRTKIQASEA